LRRAERRSALASGRPVVRKRYGPLFFWAMPLLVAARSSGGDDASPTSRSVALRGIGVTDGYA
jgi:hypothetical protein